MQIISWEGTSSPPSLRRRWFSGYRLFLVGMRRVLLLAILVSPLGLAAEHDTRTLGPFGGDVRSLAVHPAKPGLFFLGTSDGQIYSSSNRGENWVQLSPGLERRDVVVDNLQFHPSNPDILYAATWELHNNRGWLFVTRDGGLSWAHLPTGDYSSQIRAIAIAPSRPEILALGVSEGVLLSEDAGLSWRRINRGYRSLHYVESLAFDPIDYHTLYVGTWRLGWKTANLGKSWEAIHSGMIFDSDMFSLLVNPKSPSLLFASACTGIYRSENAGEVWVKLNNGLPAEAKRTRTLHFDPHDPDIIYAGTTEGLYVSHDSGSRWNRILPGLVVNAIAVSPADRRVVLVGTDDGGVLRSLDQGATFHSSNRGFTHRQIPTLAILPGSPNRIVASVAFDGAYGGIFVSSDEGGSWQKHNPGLGGVESVVRSILPSQNQGVVYLGTARGLYRGDLQGDWDRIEATQQLDITDLEFTSSTEDVLLLVGNGKMHRLALGTSRLEAIEIEILDGPVYSLLRDQNSLFAATEIGVFHSDNEGGSWAIKVEGLPPIAVNTLAKAGNQIFAGTRNGIFVSTGGGDAWHHARDVFPLDITALVIDPRDSSRILAADSVGGFLFESTDGGTSWTSHTSTRRSRILDLMFTPSGRLLAGTLSEGIYQLIPRRPQVAIGAPQ